MTKVVSKNNTNQETAVLMSGAEVFLPDNSILEKIELSKKEQRPLIVKLGFDPTVPDLRIGHAVVLKKFKEFQKFSHRIMHIIEDFTASIGNPTEMNKTRPQLLKKFH